MKTQNIFLYSLCFIFLLLFSNCKDDDEGTTGGDGNLSTYELNCCKIPPLLGCVGGAKFYVPNTFSPNGDGVNDLFSPFLGIGIQEVSAFVIKTSDNVIAFEGDDDGFNGLLWDGRVAGATPRVEGVYNYTITVLNVAGESVTFEGSVCSRINVPFACVKYEKQCAYPGQHNGEGEFDPFGTDPYGTETDCQ